MEVMIDANFGMPLGPTGGKTLLEFSDSAVRKLKSIQQEEGNSDLMLRVSVYGGGCSGFQYTFSLDGETGPADRTVEKDGATLVIDQSSYQYLAGSRVSRAPCSSSTTPMPRRPAAAAHPSRSRTP